MQRTRGAVATSTLVVALGIVAAGGCSGNADEHPEPGAGRGANAGKGGGGTSGKGTGGRPNTAGKGGSSGQAGKGGNGGSAGSPRAGTGGGSGAGDGGTGGQPVCDCTVSDSEFSCSTSLDVIGVTVPKNCELDVNYLQREHCDGGYTRYVWAVGGENDYELIEDSNGTVVYVSAFGYVGAPCDLTAAATDLGSIRAGKRPNTTCTRECSVCETDGVGAGGAPPSCAVCTPLSGDRKAVSLADYCAAESCPENLNEARFDAKNGCGRTVDDADMTTSCGVVTVRTTERRRSVSYFFDAETKALTGMQVRSEAPSGPCEATTTVVGAVPTACALESDCSLCSATAAGGAGGEGGGGAGGGGAGGAPNALPECPAP